MPDANAEVVRRFYEALERSWEAYWRNPRSLAEAVDADDFELEGREALEFFAPHVIWNAGGFGTFRGLQEIAATFDDILEIADAYSVTLRELLQGEGDRVFARVDRTIEAKGTGIPMTLPIFTVITIENGLITRLDEYVDRREALDGAGLSSS